MSSKDLLSLNLSVLIGTVQTTPILTNHEQVGDTTVA